MTTPTMNKVTTPRLEQLAKGFGGLAHPVRIQILDQMRADPLSPKGLTQLITPRVALGTVAYHVRALLDAGLIRESGTKPVRGAVEHFYRLTPRGQRYLALAEEIAR